MVEFVMRPPPCDEKACERYRQPRHVVAAAGTELAEDLRGRVFHVQRGISETTITTPKSGHPRSLTLGNGTARLWHQLEADWRARNGNAPFGPWVFSPVADHARAMTPSGLGHRSARLRDQAGVTDASLHRLRHSVATFLVARGEILQAQARLGHADAATTLRDYAYALPLTDGEIADRIDRHLDRTTDDVTPRLSSRDS